MLVNGGGAVTLQFQRSPFKALTRTSYIPWNQIHVIEPVVMASSGGVGISWAEEDTSLKLSYSEPCLPHHFDKMKPLLFSSHQPSWHQGPPYQRTIFADSGVVQEAVQVPGSDIITIIIIIIMCRCPGPRCTWSTTPPPPPPPSPPCTSGSHHTWCPTTCTGSISR